MPDLQASLTAGNIRAFHELVTFERCEDNKESRRKAMLQLQEQIRLQNIIFPGQSPVVAAIAVARLDLLHPVVSGNKIFKLKYNIAAAIEAEKKGIITMGGTYSNHLAATAFACRENGLSSIGIIRGEVSDESNPTLRFCSEHGMVLTPVTRDQYQRNSAAVESLKEQYADYFFVPEGGDNELGEKGCRKILSQIPEAGTYTHIICAMGTGTTFRGLALSARAGQTVMGIPALKIREEEQSAFQQEMKVQSHCEQTILFGFARRGYGKGDDALFEFMNTFYQHNGIPTDFVYTGKLMMAVAELLRSGYFSPAAKLLVMHTGGLQGNDSLPAGLLKFD